MEKFENPQVQESLGDDTLNKIQRHLESPEILGFEVGSGENLINFLSGLDIEDVETLIEGSGIDNLEKDRVLKALRNNRTSNSIQSPLPDEKDKGIEKNTPDGRIKRTLKKIAEEAKAAWNSAGY